VSTLQGAVEQELRLDCGTEDHPHLRVRVMLYKLIKDCSELEPMAFADFTSYCKREKHLEELLCKHLFDILFEGMPLLPFHQERSYQPEGDIYAVNAVGDLFIFELKVATVADTALDQLFRYVQVAGQWPYEEMDRKFRSYPKQSFGNVPLIEAHQEAFDIAMPLPREQFNRTQHMLMVGSAADEGLIRAVDFWKGKGLPIDFFPYRVFQIADQPYFEFFAKPYDAHTNPGELKGVLFDTCRSHQRDALRWMVEKRRVAAYGDRKDAVNSLCKGDIVFFSHRHTGLVAAAKIVGNRVKSDAGGKELYWDVEFLTPVPTNFESPLAMSFQRVREVTGKNFFWARILKVPYLSAREADHLLVELRSCLCPSRNR
jgi:hypothetical protein